MRSMSTADEPQVYQRHRTLPTGVVFVSAFPPRRGAAADFTEELVHALRSAAPDLHAAICAVDREGLQYRDDVMFILSQHRFDDYAACAARVADAAPGAVVIEHDSDLFGGPDGAWIVSFAEELTRRGTPYVVTLHTVFDHPSGNQADVLRDLCQGARSVSVFTPGAARALAETGLAEPDRIEVVPHGAPAVPRFALIIRAAARSGSGGAEAGDAAAGGAASDGLASESVVSESVVSEGTESGAA